MADNESSTAHKTDNTAAAAPTNNTSDRDACPTVLLVSQPHIRLGIPRPFDPLPMPFSYPSDLSCYSPYMRYSRYGWPALAAWPRAMRASMVSVPPCMPRDYPLQIADPEVQDTEDQYRLTFTLPEGAHPDDLHVTVSGRRLGVTAMITREDSGESDSLDWWVSRSSRTDSVSRSFTLPDGVSGSDMAISRTEDGKVEVTLSKTISSNDGGATGEEGRSAEGSSTEGGDAEADASETTEQSGASTEQSGASSGGPSTPSTTKVPQGGEPDAPASSSKVREGKASFSTMAHSRPRSLLEAVFDEYMDDLARLVWGEEVLQSPTEEEMAARAEAAREERARRVRSMRRSRMATDVVAKDGSYEVRTALPGGTTRENVTLTITANKALRISVCCEGRRPASKEVVLPRDAVLSEVSARFKAENTKEAEDKESQMSGSDVCGVEVTVGRASDKEPKRVEIQ